ncbi:MAG: GTP-binding protein [Candidatus Thorarchaeota archaeon]
MTQPADMLKIVRMGETDNTEFKRRLTKSDLRKERLQRLISRIRYMTCESPFEGRFLLGIEDIDGKDWEIYGLSEKALQSSEAILKQICEKAEVEIIEETRVETPEGMVGVYMLKRLADTETRESCAISVAGRVNSGKSTLIGTLVTGQADDGSGKARSFLLKHPQEITRGQTADIHMAFLGFGRDGEPIHLHNPLNKAEWARALDRSARVLMFADAPGHQEYSKTMIRSILGGDASYGIILVPAKDEANLIKSEEMRNSRRRLDKITREHMILMSGQEIPFIVVVSKVDSVDKEELELVNRVVRKTIKDIGGIPVSIQEQDDVETATKEMAHGVIVPVVEVSCKNMQNIGLLTDLLSTLPLDSEEGDLTQPAQAYVDKVYRGIRGTNVVVTGTVRSGVFKAGQPLVVVPNNGGEKLEGRVGSIEVFKKRVNAVKPGDMFGIDIKDVDKYAIRRGQLLADPGDSNEPCRTFEAEIVVTRHPTRISEGYTPVLQCNTIQQSVELKKIYDAEFLSVGDFARVQLEFLFRPEAISDGDKIVLREANTRAIGTVANIVN